MKKFGCLLIALAFCLPIFAGGIPSLSQGPGIEPTVEESVIGDFISDLTVYPNPSSSGIFNISFQNLTGHQLTVRVFNLIGKEVYNDKVYDKDYQGAIRLSELPRGVYILEVTNGYQKQTKRISFI